MKYFFLSLIIVLSACSLDRNSTYWNETPIKKSIEDKKLSNLLKKNSDFKTMTYEEFNLFLKDYANKAEYPDINLTYEEFNLFLKDYSNNAEYPDINQ